MTTVTFTRKQILNNPFRMKTHGEILDDLARSREDYEKGRYEEAGVVVKEIRAR